MDNQRRTSTDYWNAPPTLVKAESFTKGRGEAALALERLPQAGRRLAGMPRKRSYRRYGDLSLRNRRRLRNNVQFPLKNQPPPCEFPLL